MKSHEPDPELLAAYAEHALEGEERAAYETHLASCPACRESVAVLVRMAPREVVVAAPAPVRRAWWGWVWAMPVMATLGVLVMLRQPPAPQAPPQMPKVAVTQPAPEPPVVAQEPLAEPPVAAAPRAAAPRPKVALEDRAADKPAARPTPAPEVFAPAPPLEAKDVKKESQQFTADNLVSPYVSNQNQIAQNMAPARQQRAQEQAAGGGGGRAGASAGAVASLDAAKTTMQSAAAPPPAAPSAQPMAPPASLMDRKSKAFAAATVAPTEIPVRIEKGVLSISIDAGLNWQILKTPEPVETAKFTDPLRGEIHTTGQHVYRTIDGGKNWQQQKQ